MADSNNGIGSGTLVLSFITGIAAGVAAVLLIDSKRTDRERIDDPEELEMFI